MKIVKEISGTEKITELELTELSQAYSVFKQLRPSVSQAEFLDLAPKIAGYRVFVLMKNTEIVAYAGFAVQTNFYEGQHVFVYELVTDQAHRSKGYGKLLLDAVTDFAKSNGCEMLVLTSGLARKDAHRFYEEKMDLAKTSYVFRKKI